EAYYQLAQTELSLKQWNDVFDALRKTIDLEPQRIDAHIGIGRLYLVARDYQEAEDEASRILQEDPSNIGGYQILAAAQMGRKDFVHAQQSFIKLTKLQPDDPSVFVNLAFAE